MKKLIALLLMCCSTVAYSQNTNEPPVTETTHQTGDDGSVYVKLPFTFNYYNQQFTDSWMYDNGIISFLQPGNPNAVQPWEWNSVPLNQANGNYFIAPLWVDLTPVGPTKYITQTDGTYMKYIWQDIAEYYSAWGNWRLNTFNTTIKNDGTIETHYTTINLQTSNISVGTVGDKNAGEYNQIYYSPCCVVTTTGMIPDWTKAGPPPPPPPPTVTPPTEVYIPPVVVEETTTQPTTTTVAVVEAEPTTTTVTPTNTVVTTTLVQAATESSPASVATASIAATTSSASSDSSSNKMSIADAQSIARTNQKNAMQLVNSVVSTSIESSVTQTITVENETVNNNDMVVSNTNTSSTNTNLTNLATQSNNSVSEAGTNNPLATSSVSLSTFARLPGAFINNENNEINESRTISNSDNIEVTSQETKPTVSNNEIINTITDEVNPTSVRNLAALSNKTIEIEEQLDQERQKVNEIVANSVTTNELASAGIDLALFQIVPLMYNTYLKLALQDAAFYAPKEIYRNQTVVDNAPTQRLLQFASDIKFDQMVSQQYGEK